MKSKTNHIESKRLRIDVAFSRVVKIFGLLVLATFATLILHILYNAAPLFDSLDARFQKNVNMPELMQKQTVPLGTFTLDAKWIAARYDNCALSLLGLSESNLQSPQLVKRFAPQCNKTMLGLIGDNNQAVAMLTESGIFEVFEITREPNFQLQLLGSFQLPDTFSQVNAAENWQIAYHQQRIFVSQINGANVQAFWHDLSNLDAPSVVEYLNTQRVLPILKFEQVLTIQGTNVRVVDRQQALIQDFDLPRKIVHAQVLENAVDLVMLTEDLQLYKYTLFNNAGRFHLNRVFVSDLQSSFEPSESVLGFAETQSVAKQKNEGFRYFTTLDAQQNILLLFDENGSASIINAVTGEIVNQFTVGTNIQDIDYIRGKFVISHAHQYSQYVLDDLPGITTVQSLFAKNTYSGYTEPAYVWQTSMSSATQSAKYSVIPLIMGSLKASLLALIVALPLALGAAIFTAYFASPKIRDSVKPVIEMLEAIPSVIIGFIAAIWLAPFAERYLLSIFAVVLLMPFIVVVIALIHAYLQSKVMAAKLQHWQLAISATLLVLAVVLIFLCSILFTDWTSAQTTGGWLNSMSELSLSKTAIVVSLALGVAVAPTIYTLIDDALFEVPDGVKQAAFALGATPIQTLFKVVLVVALPSIVSAIMLGFGRAFGETMIVLMVTGNTPIADWDLFSGLRTLTSNLAIELQEAQVDSTLYHILFFTAAVLFIFTFVINTIAALLKRRMHKGI